jgi:hypothetical protein
MSHTLAHTAALAITRPIRVEGDATGSMEERRTIRFATRPVNALLTLFRRGE